MKGLAYNAIKLMRPVLIIVLAIAPCLALANFTDRVVKVADGDTLTVLVNKTQIRPQYAACAGLVFHYDGPAATRILRFEVESRSLALCAYNLKGEP